MGNFLEILFIAVESYTVSNTFQIIWFRRKSISMGAVDKVYVEGSHEKLVSPEDFDRAQELREKHKSVKTDKNGKAIGQSPCKHLWGNKLVCTCGHAMNRVLVLTPAKLDHTCCCKSGHGNRQ